MSPVPVNYLHLFVCPYKQWNWEFSPTSKTRRFDEKYSVWFSMETILLQ